MKKEKTKKKYKWMKKRHKVVFTLLRPIFAIYLKLRYNFTASKEEKKIPKNAMIYCNHTTVLDPFMIACSFRRPIYYMMNDDLFTLGFLSSVIRWLVNPIPKSKSKSDLNAVKCTLKVLKEGGTVGIFPEGNRTLSGENWEIDDSSAKLAKTAKVPLILYNIKGGYGSDPRWGGSVRRGKMTGSVAKVLYPEDLEKMSVEEIREEIIKGLKNEDITLGWKFKSKKRAEYLERALYFCPNCGSLNSIYTVKDKIFCKKCDLIAEYTEDLKLKKIKGAMFGETVGDWFNEQKDELYKKFVSSNTNDKLFDDEVEIRVIHGTTRDRLGNAIVYATKEKIVLSGKNIDKNLEFSNALGATVLGKRKINFYLEDGSILQLKGSKRFSAIKYLHLYQVSVQESTLSNIILGEKTNG